MENKLTRANKLSICLSIFYAVIALVTAFCLDASHTVFARSNPIAALGDLFSFPAIRATPIMWLMLIFVLVYLVLFVIGCCYIAAYQRRHNRKTYGKEALIGYGIALLVAGLLSFGLGALFHLSVGMDSYTTTMTFVMQSLALAALLFFLLALFVFALVEIVVYCVGFAKASLLRYDDEQEKKDEREKREAGLLPEEGQGQEKDVPEGDEEDVESSFVAKEDDPLPEKVTATAVSTADEERGKLPPKDVLFPVLSAIDEENAAGNFVAMDQPGLTLSSLVDDLQAYLAKDVGLSYDRKELALFVSALNATHLLILEGISGTGKSSLPRYFAKFIGEEAFFEPIQVTYKEKADLLGYYNEFMRRYMETPFLQQLYRASYAPERLNLMVLDEMNISRVEYYFADFLSVLEFPEEERRISLLSLPEGYEGPRHLRSGRIDLLPNTYFIGTCNKDDSTYTVTDKVIDRAIVIDFESYQKPIDVQREVHPILLSFAGLQHLFQEAEEREEGRFRAAEREKFLSLLSFMEEEFSIALGNRILRQLEKMVPVYAATGEKKEDLLDEVFSTKVLRKLSGRMDSSLSLSLKRLQDRLDELYGKESFPIARKEIARKERRLGR